MGIGAIDYGSYCALYYNDPTSDRSVEDRWNLATAAGPYASNAWYSEVSSLLTTMRVTSHSGGTAKFSVGDTFQIPLHTDNGVFGNAGATITITLEAADLVQKSALFMNQCVAASNSAPEIAGGANASAEAAENQTAVSDLGSTDDNDSEGSGLVYSLTTASGGGEDNGKFNLSSMGVLTFDTAPDFETPSDLGGTDGDNVYHVQVTVTDSGGLSDVQDIEVTVTDVDENAPSVTLSSGTSSVADLTPFVATILFSEPVNDFVVDDISVGNGVADNLQTSDNQTFSIEITPDGSGDVTIDVAEDVASDDAGNGNTAAAQLVIGNSIVEGTREVIAQFVQNRIGNLLSVQPDISGFINGSFIKGGGPLGNFGLLANETGFTSTFSTSLGRVWAEQQKNQVKATGGAGAHGTKPTAADHRERAAVAAAISVPVQEKAYGSSLGVNESENLTAAQQRGYDIWMQVHGSRSEAGNTDSTLWVGYLGGHKFLTPDFLIGGLVQLDWSDETNNTAGSSADGFGWMVGPYMAAKLPGQNLFFDARAAWGRSDNNIKPLGTYEDDFETERWMINAKLSGLFQSGGLSIRPAVSVSYFEETQESYTDSLTNTIAKQTFSQGEVRFGPTFSQDMLQDDGTVIRPKFGISGVWNFDVDNDGNSQGAVVGTGDIRARLDAGFTAISTDLWSLDITGFYDGLGVDDYHAYGGSARLTVPLQ